MKKEITITLSVFIVGGSSLLAGLDTVTATALAMLGAALGTIIAPVLQAEVTQSVSYTDFYSAEIPKSQQDERFAKKINISELSLNECFIFSRNLEEKLSLPTNSKEPDLSILNNIIKQYVECMLDTFTLKPQRLSEYSLQGLQHMLHCILVYIDLEDIGNTKSEPSKPYCMKHIDNIPQINTLILSIAKTMVDEREDQDCFKDKSYCVLQYLKHLAQKQNKQTLDNLEELKQHIQYTMDFYWTATAIDPEQDYTRYRMR